MSNLFYIYLILILLINEIIIRYNFFFDRIEFSKHKSFVNSKKIPITAGIYLLIFILIFIKEFSILSYFYFIFIFLVGFISDRLKNFSPKLRLFFQIILTGLFIINNDSLITDVRIDNFNFLLKNLEMISILFTIFCFIVLINGTNFIDGTNLNTVGYYIIVFTIILYLSKKFNLNLDFIFHYKIILFLIFLYILNFFSKTQLGDSGAYLLGFYSAYYVIDFINGNSIVSPYFAVLLFWYPCFENLFSIFRKIYQNKKISNADNLHLHHNIFLFLKLRNFKSINNLTGFVLNLSNLFLLILGANYFNSTKHLIFLIFLNISLYIVFYNILIKKNLFIKFKNR
jgi:UDP-N-acetylmuramyl pentapeptide phosphotransferase/UDP-N-acetylglucosamine-1-phosphate transferase